MAAAGDFVYPHHKEVYLTPGFMIARVTIGLGVLIVLNLLFIRTSLRADLGVAKSKVAGPVPAFWDRLTAGWKGDKEEIEAATAGQARIAPVIAIAYAIVFTVVSVDLSMSLAPHWFANMYPAWYFMSCFWSGLVYLGMFSLLSRKWMGADKLFKPTMYHDLGKLTFGLTMSGHAHAVPPHLVRQHDRGDRLLRADRDGALGFLSLVVFYVLRHALVDAALPRSEEDRPPT